MHRKTQEVRPYLTAFLAPREEEPIRKYKSRFSLTRSGPTLAPHLLPGMQGTCARRRRAAR